MKSWNFLKTGYFTSKLILAFLLGQQKNAQQRLMEQGAMLMLSQAEYVIES